MFTSYMEHSIIYVSTADHLMDDKELQSILERSRDWNKSHGLTGMLIYIEGLFVNTKPLTRHPQNIGRFMQVLEGSKEEVEGIFKCIEADARHHSIIVLHNSPLTTRNFKSWHMGFTSLSSEKFQADPGYFDLDKSAVADGKETSENLPLLFMKSLYQRSLSENTIFSGQQSDRGLD